jgi:hypothetical protein
MATAAAGVPGEMIGARFFASLAKLTRSGRQGGSIRLFPFRGRTGSQQALIGLGQNYSGIPKLEGIGGKVVVPAMALSEV